MLITNILCLSNKIYMRSFLIIISMLCLPPAYSQEQDPPLNCKDPRIPSAICSSPPLMEQTSQLWRNYLFSIESIDTIKSWMALHNAKLWWTSSLSYCNAKSSKLDQFTCFANEIEQFNEKLITAPANKSLSLLRTDAVEKNKYLSDLSQVAAQKCVTSSIAILDDSLSQAKDIASAAANSCKPYFFDMVTINTNSHNTSLFETGLSVDQLTELMQKYRNPDNFIADVLSFRANKRKSKTTKEKRVKS